MVAWTRLRKDVSELPKWKWSDQGSFGMYKYRSHLILGLAEVSATLQSRLLFWLRASGHAASVGSWRCRPRSCGASVPLPRLGPEASR